MFRDPVFYIVILPLIAFVSVVFAALFPNPRVSENRGKAGIIAAVVSVFFYFTLDQIYFSKSGKHFQDLLDENTQCRLNSGSAGCLKFRKDYEVDKPTTKDVSPREPPAENPVENEAPTDNGTPDNLSDKPLQAETWDLKVKVENLNLRSDGYADSPILSVLSQGDKLKYLSISHNKLFSSSYGDWH